jgi:hypothetical protein
VTERPCRLAALAAGFFALALGCSVLAAVVTGPGQSVRLFGSLTADDAAWDRLTADCDGDRGLANHFYDVFSVRNDGAEGLLLTITASWSGGDGFLHVFDSEQIDLALRQGCIVGNDDRLPRDVSQSEIAGLEILPGETLMIVASTFSGGQAIGPYEIVITSAALP